MFIHFGPYTWDDLVEGDGPVPLSMMNPSKLDTDQWVGVAEAMGAKYIVFTAKHEDGFCWWPTETTDKSVKNIPWRDGRGDVLGDLSKSCRERGMRLGVYLSPKDQTFDASVGGKCEIAQKQSRYTRIYRKQLTEVLGNYGTMMQVWFDGSLVIDVRDILEQYASKAMIFQGPQATIRWVAVELR